MSKGIVKEPQSIFIRQSPQPITTEVPDLHRFLQTLKVLAVVLVTVAAAVALVALIVVTVAALADPQMVVVDQYQNHYA